MSDASRSKGKLNALIRNDEELRIVMVGKTGSGKSATGNTILGFKAFESKFKTRSVTINCQKIRGAMVGRKVAVIDTPGLFDTTFTKEETYREIQQCISFASPGPHVFLIVIQLGRFTEEEQKSVQLIQDMFGQMSHAYSMILFTNGDRIEDEPIEDMLKDDPVLQGIIDTCDGRYHVFNNTTKDPSQVTELLVKINSMVQVNGGSHYTTAMFQAAERTLEEEKRRLLRENEAKRHKELAELEKKYEREAQKKAEKMMKEQQKQAERVARENEEKRRKEMEEMKKNYDRMREALKAKEDEDTRRQEAEELKRQYEREARQKEERLKKEQAEEQARIAREMEERRRVELEEQREVHERETREMQDRHEREARDTAERTFTKIGRKFGEQHAAIGGNIGAAVGGVVDNIVEIVDKVTDKCSIQ